MLAHEGAPIHVDHVYCSSLLTCILPNEDVDLLRMMNCEGDFSIAAPRAPLWQWHRNEGRNRLADFIRTSILLTCYRYMGTMEVVSLRIMSSLKETLHTGQGYFDNSPSPGELHATDGTAV
jgi:hypothetical protein